MKHLKTHLGLDPASPHWDPGTGSHLLPYGPDDKTGLSADCFAFVNCQPEDVLQLQEQADLAWKLAVSTPARSDMERECDARHHGAFNGIQSMLHQLQSSPRLTFVPCVPHCSRMVLHGKNA